MSELTQKYIKECLSYNPDTGIFIWNKRPLSHFKNEKAWKIWNKRFYSKETGFKAKNGYIQIGIDYKLYFAHRLAWIYVNCNIENYFIDHVNGNPSDNRISNLRLSTDAENKQNRRKASVINKSGFLGVFPNRGKFTSQITINRKKICLGTYSTPEEAHESYLKAKREIHKFCTI